MTAISVVREQQASGRSKNEAGGGVLRIMAGPASAARAASELGFSHLMMVPPWPGGGLASSFTLSAGTLADLAAGVAKAGVGLLMDVVLDRVSSIGGLAAEADSPFVVPDVSGLLDPRRKLVAGAALARLDGPEDAAALAAWWASRLREWHQSGVAGFRLLGLGAVPEGILPSFFAALRQAVPDAILLPWTPGLTRPAVLSLRGRGADGVFASLPWWDGRADWLWDECEALLQVAPVLGLDGVPPGPGQVGGRPVAPGLAAMLGQGWLHVPGRDGKAAELRTLDTAELRTLDTAEQRMLNAALSAEPAMAARLVPRLPCGDAGPVLGVLRRPGAAGGRAVLGLVNTDPVRTLPVHGGAVLAASGGAFGAFQDASGEAFGPASVVELAPGQARLFTAGTLPVPGVAPRAAMEAARQAAGTPRLAIEAPSPCVDGGRFPVKAVAGELVAVEADIVFDGHEKIAAALRWRGPREREGRDGVWREVAMRPLGNDRWTAEMPLSALGRHEYVVLAWRDRFETFRDELQKKHTAKLKVTLELAEGEALVKEAAGRDAGLGSVLAQMAGKSDAERVRLLLEPALAGLMAAADSRPFKVETAPIPVDAERELVRFASWYEVFPRSMSDDENRHGTFADVERHLPRIRDMGFDVLYFPPISPIGRVNRKGRNNTLTPAADDPGSPYAVGSADGGHDALHPELGTLEDFRHLCHAAAAHGLELAIDFAIQCSPDHPWLKQHRGWFDWRPDGSIKYAENPPKRYEDIVNVDFYAADAVPGLWTALCDVVLFWCEQGVRVFRVDNPHTKPFPFWEWMIGAVRRRYPDAMFLAEAFTRPKVMYRLAKIGFSQSYTYFTWRNEKAELEDYLTELNLPPVSYFFRPHFFVNTPDINPVFLQGSGRPGFLIRAALAATLSGLFGVYNGFELCEAAAVPGKEEYLDSEKYQLRAWDWNRPGNITAEITALNRMRRRNPALQTHLGVTFLPAANDLVTFYEKATADRSNVVLVAVSLDPRAAQEADIELPLWRWRLPEGASLEMDDLVAGGTAVWTGSRHRVRLTPERPYAIWRARPAV